MTTTPSDTSYAREWLAFEELSGGRTVLSGDIYAIREQFDGITAASKSMLPPPDDSVTTSDHKTDDGVAVRVYRPKDAESRLATGLYIHSGGWSCGSIDAEDHLTRQLAQMVPCVLVSVDYGLAPEYPFPAGLNDCVSAYAWMASCAGEIGGDPRKLFTVGGSAGGCLSLATALSVVENQDLPGKLCGVFALCPGLLMPEAASDLPGDLRQYHHPDAYGDSAFINTETYKICAAAYIGDNKPSNPLLSPIFHPKLGKLPYVYTTAANKDPTHDDAYMLRHRLKAEGVPFALSQYDGYPHFFHILPQLEGSRKFMNDLAQAIREWCG